MDGIPGGIWIRSCGWQLPCAAVALRGLDGLVFPDMMPTLESVPAMARTCLPSLEYQELGMALRPVKQALLRHVGNEKHGSQCRQPYLPRNCLLADDANNQTCPLRACPAVPDPATTARRASAGAAALVPCVFLLSDALEANIAPAKLELLQLQFRAVRAAGLKMMLRFAYNDSDNGVDAPPERALAHLEQLVGPVLNRNSDVLAVISELRRGGILSIVVNPELTPITIPVGVLLAP